MKYELCYLVGESKEQDLPRIKEEVSAIVSGEGGKWLELQVEEKRKMAYKVGKEVRGVYVTQQFEIVKDELEEGEVKNPLEAINGKMNLYNDILRFVIIKADELPELKVREIREAVRKDSRKPVYVKKSEPTAHKAPVEKVVVEEKKEEVKVEEVTAEKVVPAKVKSKEEKSEDKEKSIDDKINEILNI
jgi:ribosomal protein S6